MMGDGSLCVRREDRPSRLEKVNFRAKIRPLTDDRRRWRRNKDVNTEHKGVRRRFDQHRTVNATNGCIPKF